VKRKNFVFLAIMLVLVGITPLTAQAAYQGPGLSPITVAEAKNLWDDSPVLLRGKIERFLGDEKYLFTDDSGSIIIEIDDRAWLGLSVNQNDMVEVTGEVDKSFTKVEIEVSSVKKI
jgi:uncharacterized protein (TIGR00156 family)